MTSSLSTARARKCIYPTLYQEHICLIPNPEITDLETVSTLDFLAITRDKYTELQEHRQREVNQLKNNNLECLAKRLTGSTCITTSLLGL